MRAASARMRSKGQWHEKEALNGDEEQLDKQNEPVLVRSQLDDTIHAHAMVINTFGGLSEHRPLDKNDIIVCIVISI